MERTKETSEMANLVSRFITSESGATAIEYGLIVAVNAVGTDLSG
jgi:Flp pilus assembly pilin Flp